jgi:hypothetical protein
VVSDQRRRESGGTTRFPNPGARESGTASSSWRDDLRTMAVLPLAGTGTGTETTILVARALSFAAISAGAVLLVYYLSVSFRELLVEPCEDRWWYFAVGVAAAAVYGVTGLVEMTTAIDGAATFRLGATLFFFLFAAVGVRAMYTTVKLDRADEAGDSPAEWVWYVVIGAFILAWWGTYLFVSADHVVAVTTVGLAGAVTYTLGFAVLTVRAAEGTSVAAVVRQFVPALVSFAVVVVAEQAGQYTAVDPGVVVGVEVVGATLAGAFLFTTAVAIRQQSGEVTRMYDRTTWRGQRLEEESAAE